MSTAQPVKQVPFVAMKGVFQSFPKEKSNPRDVTVMSSWLSWVVFLTEFAVYRLEAKGKG